MSSLKYFLHNRSTLAAVCSENNALWRIYVVGGDLRIHELSLDTVTPDTVLYTAKVIFPDASPANALTLSDGLPIFGPVAAVAWNNLKQIRVYYITFDNKVQELRCMPSSSGVHWSLGKTLDTAAPGCVQLYAHVRIDGRNLRELRVGYEAEDNPSTITESFWRFDGTNWNKRSFIMSSLKHFLHNRSTLAAVCGENNALWRIYVVGGDLRIHELCLDTPDTVQYTTKVIVPGASLANALTPSDNIPVFGPVAAVAWNDLQHIRVYYITFDNKLQELEFTWGFGWSLGETLNTVMPGCVQLYAHVRVDPNMRELRVGYEAEDNPGTITESFWRFDGTRWSTRTF